MRRNGNGDIVAPESVRGQDVLYIHAGYPKAASTTIQNFLWTNAAVLADHGLIYPRLFDTPELARGTNPHTHNALAKELNADGPGPAWQRLREFLRERAGQKVLLSGENFSACEPSQLRAALGDKPVKVVFYVKDLAKTVVSLYAQRTKTGNNTDDFDSFFDRTFNLAHPRANLPEFFAGWARAFGAGSIAVRLLDNAMLTGGDIRLDALEAASLPMERIDSHLLEMTNDRNVSPGWKTLEILRNLSRTLGQNGVSTDPSAGNKRGRPRSQWRSEIWTPATGIERSLGLTEKGNYLTAAQFALCAARFNAQVDALEKKGMDTKLAHVTHDGFTARTFLPSVEHVPTEEVSAFLRQLLPDRKREEQDRV